jgi:hypothetical protein
MQDNAMAHTVNNSMGVLDEAFNKHYKLKIVTSAITNLNPNGIYLLGTLKAKVYVNHLHI